MAKSARFWAVVGVALAALPVGAGTAEARPAVRATNWSTNTKSPG